MAGYDWNSREMGRGAGGRATVQYQRYRLKQSFLLMKNVGLTLGNAAPKRRMTPPWAPD